MLKIDLVRKQFLLDTSTICCICEKTFSDSTEKKAIHHCHLTGAIRGVAHSECNTNLKVVNFVPVFFQNLSRYDGHHIIKHMKLQPGERLSVIPCSEEVYLSFDLSMPAADFVDKNGKRCVLYEHLRFLDTYLFMAQSLVKMAATLVNSDFVHLKAHFDHLDDQQLELVSHKSFYPYCFMDSLEKFEADLPPFGSAWFNVLSNAIPITQKDYAEVVKIWNLFGCKNMGDYHDICLAVDVLLLADIFEKFRSVCLQVYKLDPVHFFSAPNLSR